MSAAKDDILNMIADAERAHEAPAAPAAGDDINSMIDSAMAAHDAAPPPATSRGTFDGKPIDTSPAPDPIGTIDPRFGEHPTEFANGPLAPDPEELKATRAGVRIDNPAPAGHARASFAFDRSEERRVGKECA